MAGNLTLERAGLLWAILTEEQQSALKIISGAGAKKGNATASAVLSLFELDLIYRAKDFISGKTIVVLTATGKKLMKAAARASGKGE